MTEAILAAITIAALGIDVAIVAMTRKLKWRRKRTNIY